MLRHMERNSGCKGGWELFGLAEHIGGIPHDKKLPAGVSVVGVLSGLGARRMQTGPQWRRYNMRMRSFFAIRRVEHGSSACAGSIAGYALSCRLKQRRVDWVIAPAK